MRRLVGGFSTLGKTGPNSAVMRTQFNDEARLIKHMKMDHIIAPERGLNYTIYKTKALPPASTRVIKISFMLAVVSFQTRGYQIVQSTFAAHQKSKFTEISSASHL